MTFTVRCNWDGDAGVWYVEDSDVPGLVAEAPTVEAMGTLLDKRIPELLQLNLPSAIQAGAPPTFTLITNQERLAVTS